MHCGVFVHRHHVLLVPDSDRTCLLDPSNTIIASMVKPQADRMGANIPTAVHVLMNNRRLTQGFNQGGFKDFSASKRAKTSLESEANPSARDP